MVKNQKKIMTNFTQDTPFKTIESVIEQETPRYSLTGGSYNLFRRFGVSIEESINSVILELKELITFINETHQEENYKDFKQVFAKLKQNKSKKYVRAKEYLEKIINEHDRISRVSKKTNIEEKKFQRISKFIEELDKFLSGICGGETSTETTRLANTTHVCKDRPKLELQKNITNIIDANENPGKFDDGLKSQIVNKTNGIKFVNKDEVENTLNDHEKTFDEKFNTFENLPTQDRSLEDAVTINVFSRNEIENIRKLFRLFEQGIN